MFTLNCKGTLHSFQKPIVMGIINTTDDSFYAASRQPTVDAVLRQTERMLNEGATIIDIGGQSTQPGSLPLSAEQELKRVIGPIEAVHSQFPEAIISIDSFYATVAEKAVEAGAAIVNDIASGNADKNMWDTVAKLGVPYILMHMQGTPQNMQNNPQYNDVTTEILDFFIEKTNALCQKNIHDIIIDPGFGFGKSIQHNFTLLRQLEVFSIFSYPLLLGISRKSFIYKSLEIPVEDALNGTIALHFAGLMKGAVILRAHDVKEAVETIRLFEVYQGQ
ncbi:MAG TPA: dihydropteroate synthase [Chitinophagaceae bacterium]|nr:dihydropteroate synthase [Chitinophagaceae bacterium]